MADYIEREAAYRFAQDQLKKETGAYSMGWNHALGVMKGALHNNDAIPAADVVPVQHGRWKEESPDCLDGDSIYVCSVCGETWTLIEGTPIDNNMHYCPNCGAKMDGDGE